MKIKVDEMTVTPKTAFKSVIGLVVDTRDIKSLPKTDKPIVAEIKNSTKKRSLTANNYFWVLADEIAKKLNTTKDEVYQKAIEDVGVFVDTTLSAEALPKFKETWEAQGLGFICKVDYVGRWSAEVRLYYGSSRYNTEEMKRLLDWIIEEAEGQGIETLTPNEQSLMLQEWRSTHA